MILDTNFIGDLKSQNSAARKKAKKLERSDKPLRIPTIVGFELYISVGKVNKTKYIIKDLRAYKRLINNKPSAELTETIGRIAGILEGIHQRSDEKPELGPGDAIVAATGIYYDEPVVTADSDFDDVEGLTVESY